MTPIQMIVGLLSAAVSAVGFALLFRVRKKHLLATAVGGLLGYAVYLIVGEYVDGEFFPNLSAALLTAVYCEACAHCLRAPVQIYLLPVLVPLFPGGTLYHSMNRLLAQDYVKFAEYVIMTLETAFGLAGGMIVGLAAAKAVFAMYKRRRAHRQGTDPTVQSTESEIEQKVED